MESDAAPLGVVDRVGEQVVDIDDHHCEHPSPRRPPPRAEGEGGDDSRHRGVKGEVDYAAGIDGVAWLLR